MIRAQKPRSERISCKDKPVCAGARRTASAPRVRVSLDVTVTADDDMLTPTGYPPPQHSSRHGPLTASTHPALRPHRATPRAEDDCSSLYCFCCRRWWSHFRPMRSFLFRRWWSWWWSQVWTLSVEYIFTYSCGATTRI